MPRSGQVYCFTDFIKKDKDTVLLWEAVYGYFYLGKKKSFDVAYCIVPWYQV